MFFIQIPFFNLDRTYESGQNLLWKKICDGKYIVNHRDKIVQIEQNKDRFRLSCNQEDFYNIWFDYFDLGTDYLDMFYKCSYIDKELIKPICVRGNGIRIINQDLFQVTLLSMLSNNECYIFLHTLGKKRKNSILGNGMVWYEFPNADVIIKHISRCKFNESLSNCILTLCDMFNNGIFDLPPNKFKKFMKRFIHPTLCNKICIFGKHDFTKFLYDIQLKEYIDKNFMLTGKEFYDIFIGEENKNLAAYLSVLLKHDCLKDLKNGYS